MSVAISQDLKEYLARFEQKLDKISEDVSELKVSMATVQTKLDQVEKNTVELKGSQKAQIWTLIGILGTALIGTVARFILTSLPTKL